MRRSSSSSVSTRIALYPSPSVQTAREDADVFRSALTIRDRVDVEDQTARNGHAFVAQDDGEIDALSSSARSAGHPKRRSLDRESGVVVSRTRRAKESPSSWRRNMSAIRPRWVDGRKGLRAIGPSVRDSDVVEDPLASVHAIANPHPHEEVGAEARLIVPLG